MYIFGTQCDLMEKNTLTIKIAGFTICNLSLPSSEMAQNHRKKLVADSRYTHFFYRYAIYWLVPYVNPHVQRVFNMYGKGG